MSELFCDFCVAHTKSFRTFRMLPKLNTIRNNPNVSNWEWDRGYKGASVENEYPLRVDESGPDFGLEISFVVHEQDQTSVCSENDEEFEVLLTVPGESLSIRPLNEFNHVVSISTNSFLSMKPELITTSEALRSYSPNERGCFFNSERQLNFFKTYTRNNCLTECFANYSTLKMGCVPFFSPREYLSIGLLRK